ncbi:sel1 repeat family protein [Achromobacter aegrifaciens]|uniref:sel1 repeat family protein n=1 Tax=Achromobacter aegrifaciens TaxID=1287736 RepID=UPI0028AD7D14|nr:sel1 repeat family protein [Achromobacter aegrifaciens]
MKTIISRRPRVHWPALALLVLSLQGSGLAVAASLDPHTTPAQKYALALEAQTQGDYAAMTQWLRAAASDGHAPAQRMLGIALVGGPTLYGEDLCEGRRWLLRAARQDGKGADDVAYALFGRPRDGLTVRCEPA